MGYLRHECIVVSGWDSDRVAKAHAAACGIFNERSMGSLVGGLIQHIANGGAAFMISPDGSKEGWESSDRGAAARAEYIQWLESPRASDLHLDWALILIGGDDGEYRVMKSPSGAQADELAAGACQ
jgi:hypothetical protein